jgi:apolipoprotein D and lipocalin family protein
MEPGTIEQVRLNMLYIMKPGNVILVVSLLGTWSCRTIPDKIQAISPFDKSRYLGQWYEIARFDFRFEKNLINTTATYSLNPDGSIAVVNRGFNTVTQKWKQAKGKAKFVGSDTIAMLKVSFFRPFYAGYNVIAIDPEYKYALVCGDSLDYLWILSREKVIPEEIRKDYLEQARRQGFDITKFLWIQQD